MKIKTLILPGAYEANLCEVSSNRKCVTQIKTRKSAHKFHSRITLL